MKSVTVSAVLCCALFIVGVTLCNAQSIERGSVGSADSVRLRPGVAAGMGVSYMSMADVVDLANIASASLGGYQRLPEFKAAAEFFGAATVPLSPDWVLKFEYAYMLATYNVATAYGSGQAEYTAMAHLPSLIIQYDLLSAPVYNVKIGAGAGVHFGTLAVTYFTQNDRYSGNGPGLVLEAEGNTAFGENLYAYLGVNIRWDFIGTLTNAAGMEPYNPGSAGMSTTMQFFGLGARLGFTYYF